MISKAKTVDAYLATLSADDRAICEKIRALFNRIVPGVESMQYGMPAYGDTEHPVGAFNQQKHYLSIYINPDAVDPYRPTLKKLGLDCGKCCLRFRKSADIPLDLVEKMIRSAVKLAKAKP